MSVQLLDKTRRINNLLRDNRKEKVSFIDICKILSDVLASNTPALSSFLSALTITDRVIPTRSAILLATSTPS